MINEKKIIIFGKGYMAKIAHYYFENDSSYKAAAFTVDNLYKNEDSYLGLPLVSFEELSSQYPPSEYDLFVAIGYSKMNQTRKNKYEEAQSLGYKLVSYVSSKANIAKNVKIGDNCFILENNNIQPFSVIENDVFLWSGNHIGHDSKIGSHSFLASHVVVSGCVEIGNQCFFGVNSTLVNNIKIGDQTFVGAGSLIQKDTDANGVYVINGTKKSKVPSHRINF
tara:strand:- start:1380 stop:2048 length:669 start_codon:yes stop_codon:yes gene_type:complete